MPNDIGASTSRSLGIIAGSGSLPGQLVDACRLQGRDVFVVALEGFADPQIIGAAPHSWSRMAAAGRIIKLLHTNGVEDVVLAGGVQRPSLRSLRPDARGVKILHKLMRGGQGDDALLAVLVAELEGEGFRVVGASEVLGDLVQDAGHLAGPSPDAEALRDIQRGLTVLEALSPVDVGQAVVVQQGIVLGIEAAEGTDGLLQRVGAYRREGLGGVLVKAPKRDQDRRTDMPTIGPVTLEGAVRAGLRGIAIGAGETLLLDRPNLIGRAEDSGLFIVSVPPIGGMAR